MLFHPLPGIAFLPDQIPHSSFTYSSSKSKLKGTLLYGVFLVPFLSPPLYSLESFIIWICPGMCFSLLDHKFLEVKDCVLLILRSPKPNRALNTLKVFYKCFFSGRIIISFYTQNKISDVLCIPAFTSCISMIENVPPLN